MNNGVSMLMAEFSLKVIIGCERCQAGVPRAAKTDHMPRPCWRELMGRVGLASIGCGEEIVKPHPCMTQRPPQGSRRFATSDTGASIAGRYGRSFWERRSGEAATGIGDKGLAE